MNRTSVSSAPAARSAAITRAHRWARFIGPHSAIAAARREVPSAPATVAARTSTLRFAGTRLDALRSTTPPNPGADQHQPADERDPADPWGDQTMLFSGDLQVADLQDVALGPVREPLHQREGPETGDHDARNDQRLHVTVTCLVSVTTTCVPAGRTMFASLDCTAMPAPTMPPMIPPITAPLVFLPMTRPRIAPAAAPAPTLATSPPVTPWP